MTELRLYDTYARQKRVFVPGEPDRITLYVCGPTVYNRAHIGNARPAVVFDVLARLLRHLHPERAVVHAANITDVEDKIIAAAASEGVPIETITKRYADHYWEDLAALGVPRPDLVPLATENIPAMTAMIVRLIEAGHAYAAAGHVLFDVPSWPDYGRLSRRPMDEMVAGARVEVAPYKRSPADFVLWKPSGEDQPGWPSPWGRGRPGWHIECSAMIEAHLGTTIDIHGGGLDLKFPHHENELAQSACAHGGAPLARYWVHNGMVSMAEAKMSKSGDNAVRVNELLEAGHKGETLRLALLTAHYRQPLEWTDALLAQSKATLDRWYRAYARILKFSGTIDGTLHSTDNLIVEALQDDLNTPLAMTYISDRLHAAFNLGGGVFRLDDQGIIHSFRAARLMGLLSTDPDEWFQGSADREAIDAAVARRAEAKSHKDYAQADRIRAQLADDGILLEDTPTGTTWRRA